MYHDIVVVVCKQGVLDAVQFETPCVCLLRAVAIVLPVLYGILRIAYMAKFYYF